MEESFNDVKTFASDLAEAIEGRLEANTNVSSQCFDIGGLFKLLCGKRLPDGRVKLNEGNLEEYGMEEFQVFFKEVCNLEHIKMLEDERFDERLYVKVLGSIKNMLRRLVWDEELKAILISCVKIVEEKSEQNDKGLVSLHNGGYLLQMEYVEPSEHVFSPTMNFGSIFLGRSL